MWVWVWVCVTTTPSPPLQVTSNFPKCHCNASSMTLLIESCPACYTSRCAACDVHKQSRWPDNTHCPFSLDQMDITADHEPLLCDFPSIPLLNILDNLSLGDSDSHIRSSIQSSFRSPAPHDSLHLHHPSTIPPPTLRHLHIFELNSLLSTHCISTHIRHDFVVFHNHPEVCSFDRDGGFSQPFWRRISLYEY